MAESDIALRDALQAKFDEPIPARLRVDRLRAQIQHGRVQTLGRIAAVLALVALVALGGGAGWQAHGGIGGTPGPDRRLTADAVAVYHTFTVETRHPVEVRAEAGDAQLSTWLSNRLDRRIVPPDLVPQELCLMGGRVLRDGAGRTAALLMYDDDRGTRLTVYARVGMVAGTDLRFSENDGISTFSRSERDLAVAVSARMDRAGLLAVSQAATLQFEAAQVEIPRL
jgi:anti-sigma factor RsiW